MIKIAIVHEWFTTWSGSEAVLEQILFCFPDADLFALSHCPDAEGVKRLAGRQVKTSFIQKLPFGRKHPQFWLPILPLAIERLDLSGYDIVISNSHCVAKGVIVPPHCMHIAYVHSPARYAWDMRLEYQRRIPMLLRPLWAWAMHRLRAWDSESSRRPDALACNSAYIARRIEHVWRRPAEVIHPPVDVAEFTLGGERDDVFVAASRMVGYKKMPMIAQAFAEMPSRRLRIIGDGPDMKKIRAIAQRAPNIEVLGRVDRAVLIGELQRARAFIFAAEEDFGIAPVEAMSCGTPVIAFERGGVTESVVNGVTGIFFPDQSVESLKMAVANFSALPHFAADICRRRAMDFAPQIFRSKFIDFVDSCKSDSGDPA